MGPKMLLWGLEPTTTWMRIMRACLYTTRANSQSGVVHSKLQLKHFRLYAASLCISSFLPCLLTSPQPGQFFFTLEYKVFWAVSPIAFTNSLTWFLFNIMQMRGIEPPTNPRLGAALRNWATSAYKACTPESSICLAESLTLHGVFRQLSLRPVW